MSLIVQQEKITDSLIDEAMPLMIAHWKELSVNPDIPLNPDWIKYKGMDELGLLVVLTARLNGVLHGYICFSIAPNMHYKDSLQAYQDVLFVRQDKRRNMLGVGNRLIDESEEVLRGMGVQVVQHHIKVYKDFSPMLERKGYKFIEKILQKRLD